MSCHQPLIDSHRYGHAPLFKLPGMPTSERLFVIGDRSRSFHTLNAQAAQRARHRGTELRRAQLR
jgi:hypothetical protein